MIRPSGEHPGTPQAQGRPSLGFVFGRLQFLPIDNAPPGRY